MSPRIKDATGQRFGRLRVVGLSRQDQKGMAIWECVCDCGSTVEIKGSYLREGTKSCGCLHKEVMGNTKRIHGMCRSLEYNTWTRMKQRCHNPSNPKWSSYGGRGISVCERWRESFENFLEDMGPRPDGYSIDRINNAADYTPLNCRWATRTEQARNTRRNHLIFVNGRGQTSGQWAEETGIHEKTITNRIKLGWKPEAAISNPVKHPRKQSMKSTS